LFWPTVVTFNTDVITLLLDTCHFTSNIISCSLWWALFNQLDFPVKGKFQFVLMSCSMVFSLACTNYNFMICQIWCRLSGNTVLKPSQAVILQTAWMSSANSCTSLLTH